MNREILFKAKRKDSGEWIEGTGIVRIQKNTYDTDEYEIVKSVNYDEIDYFQPSYNTEEIDINTLCEYTGLKDKNGVKIFENDILQLFDTIGETSDKVTIKWNSETACYEVLQLNGNHYSFDMRCAIKPCEVIGNIFDEEVK